MIYYIIGAFLIGVASGFVLAHRRFSKFLNMSSDDLLYDVLEIQEANERLKKRGLFLMKKS